ncbi:hypothetical protein GUITHDRAFT_151376 [Guillardia theta CCMP2712]|uniref:Uncharacterized protein n=1 Tax=Guillardia theta (strain CCMP2712) TaxID=905079 RepID=L1JPE1_GUITC|nr:hypothetical protein GUITHDRAFT_151376 [Guillardia theta CCMP2712]EKX50070.1 hypothetical protein GUITHDRAFT_151376 [Guillardia theta CCMP2712]|mmetsp:Transcript_7257/g.25000  ORF Transcript_7257/g.25000 Transcript_7257/m.25000 type:complete len:81 (+) Transcript_7257:310-552(+)|eukprot:XP_005837050.1 hypothetical protein GUITHDRAFT_151376 [Guillardia theta CCMP2712]
MGSEDFVRQISVPSIVHQHSFDGLLTSMVDGVSTGERHDAMRLLKGTWMSPVDSSSYSGALKCFSGSVDEKYACWNKKSA